MAEGSTNAQGSSSVTKPACSYSEVTLKIEPHLDVWSRGSDNSSDYYVSFTLTPAYGKSLPDGILRVDSIGVIRDLGDAGTAIEQVAGYAQPIPASDTPYTFISQPISNCIGIGTVSSCSFGDSMLTDVKEYGDFKFNSSSLELDKKIDGCFNAVGLGSDGKSLDFTAVDGQVNNIVIPSPSDEWKVYSGEIFSEDASGLIQRVNSRITGLLKEFKIEALVASASGYSVDRYDYITSMPIVNLLDPGNNEFYISLNNIFYISVYGNSFVVGVSKSSGIAILDRITSDVTLPSKSLSANKGEYRIWVKA